MSTVANRVKLKQQLQNSLRLDGSTENAEMEVTGQSKYKSRKCRTGKYTVSQKNVPPLACYNFDAHEWILILFGINVTDKVGSQKRLYHATSNNLCFCTTWQNAETRKSHIPSVGLCYTHNASVRYLPE